jgi:hypothetical protein
MTTSQKQTMHQQIEQHGNNLNAIFNTGLDAVNLCKKLRRLENEAHKLATDYCNGDNGIDSENWEDKITPVMHKVYSLLNNGKYNDDRPHQKKVPIFLNGDARGYALKINGSYVKLLQTAGKNIYTDWGGYGIICPDFTPNN